MVLRLFERVVLEPLLERVEPPLRLVVRLRDVELPDERLVVPLLLPPLLVVLRLDVLRFAPVRDRVDEPLRPVVVRLREEVERPVVRLAVEPLRVLLDVVRFAVVREPAPLRDVVLLRAVAFPPLLPAARFCAVEVLDVDVRREAVPVFRAVVLRAVVLRAVAFPPLLPAARFCAVERFVVDELRDVFDAPLVFRPVVLVRANALRLPSSEISAAGRRPSRNAKRIVKTRSDVIRKRA